MKHLNDILTYEKVKWNFALRDLVSFINSMINRWHNTLGNHAMKPCTENGLSTGQLHWVLDNWGKLEARQSKGTEGDQNSKYRIRGLEVEHLAKREGRWVKVDK